MQVLEGSIVDVISKEIFPGRIHIGNGKIKTIQRLSHTTVEQFILPGLIDAHVHLESSMLVPSEFARIAVTHGTVGTVSDPHEIANVLGVAGVDYMIENGKQVPFHFNFGAPSCVPATSFETAGAIIDSSAIEKLLQRKEIRYLSEMMNYPGVLHRDAGVMKKIGAAKKTGKPVDGHAPGLTGDQAEQYIAAGISTDHECFSYEEGLFKLQHGMKVIIREGSAAKNFEALIPLLDQFPDMIMFCSDDKHPDDLLKGHINQLVVRALAHGCNSWNVLRAATLNPILHYKLECGLLRENDSADFMVIDDFEQFNVLKTFVRGEMVAKEGKSFIETIEAPIVNNFHCSPKSPEDFSLPVNKNESAKNVRVIEALDGQLITKTFLYPASRLMNADSQLVSDIENDVLKFTVVNRYSDTRPAVAFIKNFGLKIGAIASSVGHDSHNILAVGVSDDLICRAVNFIIEAKGGQVAVTDDKHMLLSLPVAGIMTHEYGYAVATYYEDVNAMVRKMGSTLRAPFMTLSFMALLVIPQLKLSDKGLFDGAKFEFAGLFE